MYNDNEYYKNNEKINIYDNLIKYYSDKNNKKNVNKN